MERRAGDRKQMRFSQCDGFVVVGVGESGVICQVKRVAHPILTRAVAHGSEPQGLVRELKMNYVVHS